MFYLLLFYEDTQILRTVKNWKYFSGGGVSLGYPRGQTAFPQTGGLRPKAKKRVPKRDHITQTTSTVMKSNVIIRGAQTGAEKVLMANVVVCTGIIGLVESIQELSFNTAVTCRSQRMRINPEQAAEELTAQHKQVVDKAKASADRIKGILSKKSIQATSN
jgi:hypothetical protein